MFKNRIAYIGIVAVVCLFLTACSNVITSFDSSAQTSASKEESVSEPTPPHEPEIQEFIDNIKNKIKSRDFEALEALSKTYRENKERFKNGGGWKIASFYSVASNPASEKPTDNDWSQHIAFLREWKEKLPESITARAMLANGYLDYAWYVRGNGYANKVSKENWRGFEERTAQAAEELGEAAKLKDKCYGYYFAWLTLAKAQAWNRERYNRLFDEAVQYDSLYPYFYGLKATYLLPRWHGEPGEWEDFANNVKTKLGEPEGLKMYYRIVMDMSSYHGADFFERNRVSWEDTKKGFLLFEKEFGMNRYKLNEFGRLAIHAGDVQMGCKIFSQLKGENDFEPEVWSNRKNFERYRSMGLESCTVLQHSGQAQRENQN